MRWLDNWRADVAALRALEGERSILLNLAIDAAVILVIMVNVLLFAALVNGAGQ